MRALIKILCCVYMLFAFGMCGVPDGKALAAGPYLVCNPDPGTTSFNVSGLPASINATNLPVDSTGAYGFKLDLSALPPGSYTVTATACTTDPNWGAGCSAPSAPFSLTRPGPIAAPTAIGLTVK